MRFRNALDGDKKSILRLYDEVKAAGKISGYTDWNEYYPTEEILDADYRDKAIFVLEDNGSVIASVSILAADDLDNEPLGWQQVKSCVPARLCVSVACQHKGIARTVMQNVISRAKENGFQSIRLLASVINIPANRLYAGLGFTKKGSVRLYGIDFFAYELLIT
jgi:ribosomal protein S18 acetylase RimI-like enzyme